MIVVRGAGLEVAEHLTTPGDELQPFKDGGRRSRKRLG
jgi:hypothetical protein